MDSTIVTAILADICSSTGLTAPIREPLRVWGMSGVERLRFDNGRTAIYKYAVEPFEYEDRILRAADRAGIPVPQVIGSIAREGTLGMVIEDLGEPAREAQDADGAVAAAALHAAPGVAWLPVMDEDALAALPELARGHLRRLRGDGRWSEDTADITAMLEALVASADKRATGTGMAPFGWVHSEFHPTSLHFGTQGWRLLDFARAFTGPGLLDLASWHGTTGEADPVRLRAFIEMYVAAGGPKDALAERGGLPAERWALGWHRVWAVEWFMEQAVRWINNRADDSLYIKTVRRHLTTALQLLEA
ncbi:aminoglycoside phosphotransferase family protein [Kitasatospora sp. RB6PN24]|uniref:phosphotransferase n=1 Tax=Kitasatospora humi TaxID=2893891 RepID=UPI001E4D7097|nr:phosphotransferase [Kitasatospora humi]MCC9308435.1 aminoglycoside phosphotransferase family protein [Kitasatospora humi]